MIGKRNVIALATAWLLLPSPPAAVQAAAEREPPAPAAAEPPPPAQVRELLTLLADPTLREWLARREAVAPSPPDGKPNTIPSYFSSRVGAIRQHLVSAAAALSDLPAELERAGRLLRADIPVRGTVLLFFLCFVASGFGAEWMFRKATAKTRRHLDERLPETVSDRLKTMALRLAYGAGLLAAFAFGSVGGFLVFDWPPLLREIVLGYLLAFVLVRVALAAGDFLLSPSAEGLRIVPMDAAAARFWRRRLGAFVGWFAFGWVTVGVAGVLGVSPETRQVGAYALGLGLLAVALETVWRRPHGSTRPDRQTIGRGTRDGALSLAAAMLWALWVAGAMPVFWLLLVILALPGTMTATQRAVDHVLRSPGATETAGSIPSVAAVCLERGTRVLLITGAVALLAWAWGINHVTLLAQDTLFTRLARGALSAVVIVLLADAAWQLMKVAIDRKLGEAWDPGQPDTHEARRRARLRTLLPVLRNILFAVVIAAAGMMALSALGVEIAPLIAGAGVIGVAIGFGAQTLFRDIISGVFYLLDDAFRVGEYIQSGTYKGTVESFSLRSVKLRHHRGPVYTVPFGMLGAVQNMSRDWVIDKLTVGVTYDTDLDKVKKLIRQIGKELAQDAELAPHFIEPLKMQGVEQFGDFAIQIRMKMMTKPNEQFVIRRRAYAMIKKAFDANGIKFAFPTVQVAGDGELSVAAAAQRGLELVKPVAGDA